MEPDAKPDAVLDLLVDIRCDLDCARIVREGQRAVIHIEDAIARARGVEAALNHLLRFLAASGKGV